MPDNPLHSDRKLEHLRINLEQDVQFHEVTNGFERYRFVHQALPDIALESIDLSQNVFGKILHAPMLVSSMTGGVEEARRINRNLAFGAQAAGIAMGLGSQRAAIEDESFAGTYQVRDLAPDILLFANLGAIQLNYRYGIEQCRRAVDMIEADALFLHLNPVQEAVQEGGDTDFSALASKIAEVCRRLEVPVVAKEVGWGISERAACPTRAFGLVAMNSCQLWPVSRPQSHRVRKMRQPRGERRLGEVPGADQLPWLVPERQPGLVTFGFMAATIAALTFLYGLGATLLTHFLAERLRANPAISRALQKLAGAFLIGFGIKLIATR